MLQIAFVAHKNEASWIDVLGFQKVLAKQRGFFERGSVNGGVKDEEQVWSSVNAVVDLF